MEASAEFDLHLRRHGIGSCGDGGIHFDWDGLAARSLHLIPAYEMKSDRVYRSVLERGVPVRFYRSAQDASAVPDPDRDDFFVEVESAVASLADLDGTFVYLSFYSEEAYLALTEARAFEIFEAGPGEILAQSLLSCVSDGTLRMRRHRHGIQIFEKAAQHHSELQRRLGGDDPGFAPWR